MISKIIETRIGKGILSKKELSKWEEVFKQTLKEMALTVEEYLASNELVKETVWEAFRKRKLRS